MVVFGVMRVTMLLAVEWAVLHSLFGKELATGIVSMITICAFLSEPFSRWFSKLRNINKVDGYTRNRITNIRNTLVAEVKKKFGLNISHVKVYVIPDDEVMEAKAYGIGTLGITRAALQLDDITVLALLSHSAGQMLRLDVVFNRLVQVTLLAIIVTFLLSNMLLVACLWFGFLVACLLRKSCIWSFIITNILVKVARAILRFLEQVVVLGYGLLMRGFNCYSIIQADKFVSELSLGRHMIYFLDRFACEETQSRLGVSDYFLKMTPSVSKRKMRLENFEVLRLKRA